MTTIRFTCLGGGSPGQPGRNDYRAQVGWPSPPLRIHLTRTGVSLREMRVNGRAPGDAASAPPAGPLAPISLLASRPVLGSVPLFTSGPELSGARPPEPDDMHGDKSAVSVIVFRPESAIRAGSRQEPSHAL